MVPCNDLMFFDSYALVRWRLLLALMLRCALLVALLLWSGLVWSKDHITQRAWLVDPTGQSTWSDVSQLPVQVYEGVLSRGFGDSVIWLRLRIDPNPSAQSQDASDTLILRIRPVYLDDIQVFDPQGGGRVGVSGDKHHPDAQVMEGLDFLLPIARGASERYIWLRLKSTSTRQISVQAFKPQDLQRHAHQQQLIYALYVGVILIFVVWGLVQWLFSQELVIGVFALKQTAALMYALCSLGYVRFFWPLPWSAEWLNILTSVFSILAVSVAIYFHVVLIREFDPPRWLLRILQGLVLLLPVKLLLLFMGHPLVALQMNMTEVLLTPMLLFLAVCLARGWSKEPAEQRPVLARWVVVGFYALLVAILAVASLPGMGLAKGGEIPLYVVQAHGLVTAFLILLMLQYRAHVRQQQQSKSVLNLQQAQLQAQQEREIRQEQSNLLAMLAHEIKTPLATMHMRLDANAHGSAEIRSAIREMDAVIERCLQTAQFGDSQIKSNPVRIDLVSLVQQAVSICPQPQRVLVELPEQWVLSTDPQLLHIVLINLLENACKYARPNSPIVLSLEAARASDGVTQQACFSVSNEPGAAGWPDADKVFDKYYRSPHARRQAGSGLGLFLVRNLVGVLGGRIAYAPDDRQVKFVFYLPV